MEEAAPLAGAADYRSFPEALCSGFYPAPGHSGEGFLPPRDVKKAAV